MRIKIYQSKGDRNNNQFMSYDFTMAHGGIDESLYKNVFYGDVDCEGLEDLYTLLNTEHIPTHQGYTFSVSDIVEVIDSENEMLNGRCFYCDSHGYKTIDFDTSKCQEMNGLKCIYITPHHTPIELNLEINNYKVLRDAVEGTIEITHPFHDNIAIVSNDEAKLINMEGNHKVGSSIYAGPMLIVGDNGGEDFIALTQEQADRYMKHFEEPEQISYEEVQSDTGFTFIGFN